MTMDRFAKRKLTKEKRKTQICRVFEVKIDRSCLSLSTIKHLVALFKEAKWFYNYCISQNDINDADTTAKSVPVKVLDAFEDRQFDVLQAHMKQGIKTRLFGSLVSLRVLKEHGRKIGGLRFKSEINSIPLKEYKNTYRLSYTGNE